MTLAAPHPRDMHAPSGPGDLPQRMRRIALRLLQRRDHSRAELMRRLLASANRIDAAAEEVSMRDVIAKVLDDMVRLGLLDDQRTAQSLLTSQARRFGFRRIEHTMRAKGLDPEIVASAVQQARATELERAQEIWRRRFGARPVDATDVTERARQARFLAGRGFDAEVIRQVLKAGAGASLDD